MRHENDGMCCFHHLHYLALFLLAGAMSCCASAAPTCPAPFAGSGNATFYYIDSNNACTLDTGDGLTAALSTEDYAGSAHCGECLQVTGPNGSVLVHVTDKCPGCSSGDLDLSAAAFAAIANPVDGVVNATWHRVACPVTGNVAFKFEGSNPYYIKLQVRDHRYGISGMELFDTGSNEFLAMTRSDDNHFVATSIPTPVSGSLKVRVTSTSGEALEQNIAGINNSLLISGTAQFEDCGLIFRDGFEVD